PSPVVENLPCTKMMCRTNVRAAAASRRNLHGDPCNLVVALPNRTFAQHVLFGVCSEQAANAIQVASQSRASNSAGLCGSRSAWRAGVDRPGEAASHCSAAVG